MISKKRAPLSTRDKAIICSMFACDKLSLREIAPLFDRTPTAIWKVLKEAGVNTGKDATAINVACMACGREWARPRKQALNNIRNFCSVECYYDFLRINGGLNYRPWRHGQRKARDVLISYGVVIPAGGTHVIHHIDGDCRNNEPSNLMLFASQSDHAKWHRGVRVDVKPLWP